MEIEFDKIAVGQWVWACETPRWGGNDRDPVIKEVVRLTPTLIVCDDDDTFFDRYKRKNGWSVASASYGRHHITGIATQEEIETIGIPRKEYRIAEKARRKKNDDMASTLPAGMKAYVYPDGSWSANIELKGLTEEQVNIISRAVRLAVPTT